MLKTKINYGNNEFQNNSFIQTNSDYITYQCELFIKLSQNFSLIDDMSKTIQMLQVFCSTYSGHAFFLYVFKKKTLFDSI